MYARKVDDKVLTFDFVSGLRNNNLLFVDRETGSVWSQLEGAAISGAFQGQPLTVVPSIQTTWKYWKQAHPQSWVLIARGSPGFPYLYQNQAPGSPPLGFPQIGHDLSALGLGVALNGEALFLPWKRLKKAKRPLTVVVGGRELQVHVARDGLTAWAETASGQMIATVMVYKRGWFAFHPDSRIYKRRKK